MNDVDWLLKVDISAESTVIQTSMDRRAAVLDSNHTRCTAAMVLPDCYETIFKQLEGGLFMMSRLGNNGRKFVLSIQGWAVLLFMSQGGTPF